MMRMILRGISEFPSSTQSIIGYAPISSSAKLQFMMRMILRGISEFPSSTQLHQSSTNLKRHFAQKFQLHDGSPGIHPLYHLVAYFHKLAYGDADD